MRLRVTFYQLATVTCSSWHYSSKFQWNASMLQEFSFLVEICYLNCWRLDSRIKFDHKIPGKVILHIFPYSLSTFNKKIVMRNECKYITFLHTSYASSNVYFLCWKVAFHPYVNSRLLRTFHDNLWTKAALHGLCF